MEKVIICFVIGVFLASLLALNPAVGVIVIAGLLLGIFIIFMMSKSGDHKFLFKIFIIGFLLRLLLSGLFYFLSLAQGGNGFLFDDDGIDAGYNAIEIAKLWQKGIFPDIQMVRSVCPSTRLVPYHYWNAFIYYFTGWNPLVMFFINCLVGALTIALIYMIAKEIFNKKVAIISSLCYAFWPSIFLWSTMNSKEPLTMFFICLAIWSYINLKRRFSLRHSMIMVLSILLLSRLRTAISVLLAFAIILSFLFPYKKINKRLLLLRIVISGTAIFLIVCVTKFRIFIWGGDFYNLPVVGNIFEAINYEHNIRAIDASTAFLAGVDISTPLRALLYLPFALFIVLFAPFPWKISNSLQLMAVTETLIWYILLPFIFRGILLSLRHKGEECSVIILFIILMWLMLALFEGNVGTVFRHKSHIIPFCLIFAAFGLAPNTEKERLR